MSLKEEDRQILVQLELEKADKSFRQVEVLHTKDIGTRWPIAFIICFMLSVHC